MSTDEDFIPNAYTYKKSLYLNYSLYQFYKLCGCGSELVINIKTHRNSIAEDVL